jgi:uridine kinase
VTVAQRLAAAIDALHPERRVLVAVDGPDAAGKTTLAMRLTELVARPVVLASIDDWHHPKAVRWRRGDDSGEGYYRDAFDVEALTTHLLAPFAGGAPRVVTGRFDHRTDRVLLRQRDDVAAAAALVVEGVFLLRPALRDRWDLAVHLHVPEDVVLARALERERDLLGGPEQVRARYERRYLAGQALYRAEAAPLEHADVLLDNRDPTTPVVLRWR